MFKRIGLFCGITAIAMGLAIGGCKKSEPPKKSETPKPQQKEAAPAVQGEPIKVGAILSITGPASFLGAPESKTLDMYVENLNQAGGVLGRKIELIIKDSGGKPENAISMAKQLIDENKVLAILGPSTSGETMAIKTICQEGKTILLSCAAAEDIVNPVASFVFKTPQKDSDAARWIFKTMKDKGITKVGVISSNDGFGMAGAKQLAALAPASEIAIAISEVYDKQATDLTDILTKLKGKDIQAVINWSIVPAQSLVAKNMKQVGLEVPLFQSHGFGNIKYVQAGGEAANGTIFPAGRLLVAEVLPDSHPQKKLLLDYKKAYESKYQEDASTFGGHAYDAMLILVEGIKKAGKADTESVRAAIETLKGVVGTAGVFNLSPEDHNGLALDAFEMQTVKDGKFALYTK